MTALFANLFNLSKIYYDWDFLRIRITKLLLFVCSKSTNGVGFIKQKRQEIEKEFKICSFMSSF